jgi:protein-disulfide isomerase
MTEENLSKKDERELRRQSAEFKSKLKKAAWTVAGLAVVGGLAWLIMLGSQEKTVDTGSLLVIASDDHTVGPADAPVTLVEYLDFECEACGAYYPLIKQLAAEFPNDLRIVTRYFPLPGHKNSVTAALAVEAAARQGKYWEMHDVLFENQEKWGNKQMPTPQVFEEYAAQIGLDMEKFKADVADPTTRARVMRDFNASENLGNTGTPSLFVNGKKIDNPRGYEPFKALIQAEIDSAPKN